MFNLLIQVILTSGIYAVMAIGLSLIFGIMGIVNLAHPGVMMLGAYFTYELVVNFSIFPIFAIAIVFIVFFGFGMLLEKILLSSFSIEERKGLGTLLLLVGVWLILQNSGYLIWGADKHSIYLPEFTSKVLSFGPANIGVVKLIILIIAFTSIILLNLFLKRSFLGKAIRASCQNYIACQLSGIDNEKISMISFGLGVSFASLSGSLLAFLYSFSPEFGGSFLIRTFAVVIIGGLGDIRGTIIGAFLLAMVEIFGGFYLGSSWQSALVFITMIVVLVFVPQGIANINPGNILKEERG